MTQGETDGLVTEHSPVAVSGERVGASIPFSIVSLAITVLSLALVALPLAVAGIVAAAVITVAVVFAIIAIARSARGARGLVLAVVALGVAVLTGSVTTAVGVGSTISFAYDAQDEIGASSPADIFAGEGETSADVDSQISGQWVVDELLRECRAGHLHAVAAPGSTTLYLVGERPVSVDGFSFTVTVEPGADTWAGVVRGEVPPGSPPLSGDADNPLECENIELDAQSGNPVSSAGGDASGDSGSDSGGDSGSDDSAGVDSPPAPEGEVNYWELEVGMCLNDATLPERFSSIPLVDCAEPHDSEVYAIEPLADGPYPGDEEIFRAADEICLNAFEPYVGTDYDASLYYYAYYWPDKNGWGAGDRDLVCIVYDQNGQIEGSVRGSGR